MNRITPEHLSRSAIVHVRQSTMHQLRINSGSRNRQYDLKLRAAGPGWPEVTVIDDDPGAPAAAPCGPVSIACRLRSAGVRSA